MYTFLKVYLMHANAYNLIVTYKYNYLILDFIYFSITTYITMFNLIIAYYL